MAESNEKAMIHAGVEMTGTSCAAVIVSPESTQVVEKAWFTGPDCAGDAIGFLTGFEGGRLSGAGVAFHEGSAAAASGIGADLFKLVGSKPLMERSALAGAVGEAAAGAGRGAKSLFYVTLGTPVGGAFIMDGELWRGFSGLADRFGNVVIGVDGQTVNDFATDESILRRTRNRFHQDHTSSLVSMEEAEISVEDIVREAQKGDEFAVMMLERTGLFAGVGVGTVISLLNVERVVVGGLIVQAGTNVLEGVIAGASENSPKDSFEAATIVPAELGAFSAAVGVAVLSARR
jgi:glucokinase